MKKMIIVVLGLALALSLAGMGIASDNTPVTAQVPASCPVMGGKVNQNISTDYKGRQVYFCCPPCLETFKQDPEKYLKKQKQQ